MTATTGWRYDSLTGVIRDWRLDADGNMRWSDDGTLCPDQVLKGNADLVPAQHATMPMGETE